MTSKKKPMKKASGGEVASGAINMHKKMAMGKPVTGKAKGGKVC